jgi:hypothetical protein
MSGRASVRGFLWRCVGGAFLSATLVACGGGGGGDADNSWLQFTPDHLEATTYEGESVAVDVTATSSKTISETLYIGVVDTAGVITPDVTITQDGLTFHATVKVSPTLAAGTYTGNITVRLCRDDAATCANPYPGSPWQVPYSFEVLSGTNLTALAALPGVGAWGTYQGNASHTGYVAANLAASRFSRRWAWQNAASAVAVSGGRVFTVSTDATNRWKLSALKEADGSTEWEYDMGPLSRVNAPAVAGTKVYVTSTGHADTFMWAFDAATGALLAKRPMSSQWEQYLAPTVYKGAVYTESGAYGGLTKFDTATVTEQWWSGLDQYDMWTPAVDDRYAYTLAGSIFVATNVGDGSRAFQIEDTGFDWHGYTMAGAPVLDGGDHAFASSMGGRLVAFSLTDRTMAWSLAEQIQSDPALANGVMYVVNGPRLEARSPASGDLLWSWDAPDGIALSHPYRSQVVVTNNIAFVAGGSHTYAVDLTSHTSSWNYPAAGSMAISSNGVLYIASREGRLVAINLH